MTPRARFTLLLILVLLLVTGLIWFVLRYDDQPRQVVAVNAFISEEYPENPETKSSTFGTYPHRQLIIESVGDSRFRFLLEPATADAAAIELTEVDLAHFVAAVPPWVKADPDLTKVGLIDREWNRQQVRFP